MKMVMEKSWNMKKWPKVMEFCDSVREFYQFCPQFVRLWSPLRNYAAIEKAHIFRRLPQNIGNSKSGREMVMESLEMLMAKSWKNIL